MKTAEMIEVMQAHLDGKVIECRARHRTDKWDKAADPVWNFPSFDYRVEPKEIVKETKWCVVDRDGDEYISPTPSRETAEESLADARDSGSYAPYSLVEIIKHVERD